MVVSPSAIVHGVFVGESGEGVVIINCAVKASKANSEEMELVCGSKTKLVSSPKKFKLTRPWLVVCSCFVV